MFRTSMLLVAIVCFFVSAAGAEEKKEWISLFDGKSLAGWKTYHGKWKPQKSWVVEEGVLHLKKPLGFVRGTNLISEEQFADFELEFEWKVSPKANSGVMYLVRTGDAAPYLSGPEYQVNDDANYRRAPQHSAASLYDVVVAEGKKLKPTGEWNKGRIVLKDNLVEHWLNGSKVVSIKLHSDDWKKRIAAGKFKNTKQLAARRKGHIALQDHGDRVWYRNIRIRRLSP